MRRAQLHILSIMFAVILRKTRMNVAMATVLLKHSIFIKCLP